MLSPRHCADDDDGNGQMETERILFSGGGGGPIRISHFPSGQVDGRTNRSEGERRRGMIRDDTGMILLSYYTRETRLLKTLSCIPTKQALGTRCVA